MLIVTGFPPLPLYTVAGDMYVHCPLSMKITMHWYSKLKTGPISLKFAQSRHELEAAFTHPPENRPILQNLDEYLSHPLLLKIAKRLVQCHLYH